MKKFLVTALQLAVTAFALYWVFRKPADPRRAWRTALHEGDFCLAAGRAGRRVRFSPV